MKTAPSKMPGLIRPNFHWDDEALFALMRRSIAVGSLEPYGAEAVRHLIDPENPVFVLRIPAHGYVYEQDGELLGLSGWTEEEKPGSARITHCYVIPEAFGTGTGYQLLGTVLDQIRKEGFADVYLRASLNAEGFYKRFGFKRTGTHQLPITADWSIPGAVMQAPEMNDFQLSPGLNFIRAARDEDADGIIDLIGRCFEEYDGVYLDVENEEPILKIFGSGFKSAGGESWVLERGGAIKACVGWTPIDGGVELKKLYLDQDLRGQGLAEIMMDLVIDAAQKRGANRIELWSDTKFTRAHRFYEKNGFERTQDLRALNDISDTTEYRFIRKL
ncbi:MAG: GNAT family N-acetyltransferase [Sphingomonadales bacterium]|jgi:GNAT superfamily N-acetyltransferase